MSRFDEWRQFHKANPVVFDLFRQFAEQALTAGREHLGARIIGERIRWYTNVETKSSDDFRVNDHFWPYYSRLLMLIDERFDGFFECRDARFDATADQILSAHNGHQHIQRSLFS